MPYSQSEDEDEVDYKELESESNDPFQVSEFTATFLTNHLYIITSDNFYLTNTANNFYI